MGFIQRANETAEYLAVKENNPNLAADDPSASTNVQSEASQPPLDVIEKQQPTASVQVQPPPPVPEVETNSASSEPVHINENEQDETDVFEDPTPPQALEGRLAGLDPVIGTPQMSLGDAVAAGTTHGGLHFPKDKFIFSGVVADVDQKLQDEIAEWQ